MSKVIKDYNDPSEEERAWAEQFPTTHGALIKSADEQRMVAERMEAEAQVEQPRPATLEEEQPDYESMTTAELQKEIQRRNQEYGLSLPTVGKKDRLMQVLRDDDKAAAETDKTAETQQ